jgi:ABC-type oligopeptide transport system substrate-binding subunit
LQLENGIYIPASPPKEDIDLNIVTVKQFEWSINKEIAGISSNWNKIIEGKENECGVDTTVRESTNIQFEELYQQFRLMVSNWLTSYKAGSGIRKDIEDIIFNS